MVNGGLQRRGRQKKKIITLKTKLATRGSGVFTFIHICLNLTPDSVVVASNTAVLTLLVMLQRRIFRRRC